MRIADLQRARQAAANAQAGLESAQARIRELETIAETLNRRLAEGERARPDRRIARCAGDRHGG